MFLSDGMVYLRPTKLAYIRKVGPYTATIGTAWTEMLHWLEKHGLRTHAACGYGLLRDNPSMCDLDACRYDACIPVLPHFEESARRELSLITLPPGPYARKRSRGNYRAMTSTIAELHSVSHMSSNLRIDERRPIVTVYLDDPRRTDEDDLRLDVCIPVAASSIPFPVATADAA